MTIWVGICLVLLFGLFVKVWTSTASTCHDLKREIEELDHKVGEYNERYVQPRDEFLYKWNREPTGTDEEFEIIQWCQKNKVRYAYLLEQSPTRANFSVWITEPKLAMEFKLRWH